MSNSTLADIDILLLESDPAEAQRLARELMARGFAHVTPAGTFEEAHAACLERMFDLVVCESADGAKTQPLARAIRFGEAGENPFVVIFSTLKQAELDAVMQAINGGVDNLLARPFAASELIDRIESMVHDRKPFVVTSDYIGPVRQFELSGDADLPLVQVPNTLRDKAMDRFDPAHTRQEIRRVNSQVSAQVIVRCLLKITPAVQNIALLWERGMQVDSRPHLERLKVHVSTIEQKLKGTPDEHVAELCVGMLAVIEDVRQNYRKPATKDIRLMQNLAQAIHMSLKPDEKIASLSKDIAGSIIGAKRDPGSRKPAPLAPSVWPDLD